MNDNMKRRAFAVKAFADASVENVKKLVMTLKRF